MADTQSKWALNIDKIAYGVAGVLGLVVLAIPLLYGRENKEGALNAAAEDLRLAVKNQKLPDQNAPDLEQDIKRHWTPGPALEENASWVTERPPVFIKLLEKAANFDCKHEASSLVEICCERDPAKKQVFLRLKGKLNEANEYVTIKKLEIIRKEGEGEPAVIGTAQANAEFEYKDTTVAPGKVYSYGVKTTVVKDPKLGDNVKFSCEPVKTSELMGPASPIPYEFSLVFQTLNEGKFFGKLEYFDYKENKVVSGQLKEFKEREKFADGRFEIFTVDQTVNKVTVRVAGSTSKDVLSPAKEHRPVAAWECMGAGGAAAPPEDATPAAEEKEAPGAKAEPKAKATKAAANTAGPSAKKPPEPKATDTKGSGAKGSDTKAKAKPKAKAKNI